jgi:hypothetical protein
MSNRLVICSSPEDDDYVGEQHNADFVNISEYSIPDLRLLVKKYQEVILFNNSKSEILLYKLKTIANLLGLEYNDISCDKDLTFYENGFTQRSIKPNEILFLGCSHTFGIGHDTSDTVYTHVACRALNKKPLVDARQGKGNMSMENLWNTYNLKDATVVVQFTDMYRIQFNKAQKQAQHYDIHDSFVFTDQVLASEFTARVKRMVNLFRAHDCKFCFFQLKDGDRNVEILHEVDMVLSKYPEFIYNDDWVVDYGTDGCHYGPKTHTRIADEIVNSLNVS